MYTSTSQHMNHIYSIMYVHFYLGQFGCTEGRVRMPRAIQRPNALLQRQQTFVDLTSLETSLVVRVQRVGGALAARQVHKDQLTWHPGGICMGGLILRR